MKITNRSKVEKLFDEIIKGRVISPDDKDTIDELRTKDNVRSSYIALEVFEDHKLLEGDIIRILTTTLAKQTKAEEAIADFNDRTKKEPAQKILRKFPTRNLYDLHTIIKETYHDNMVPQLAIIIMEQYILMDYLKTAANLWKDRAGRYQDKLDTSEELIREYMDKGVTNGGIGKSQSPTRPVFDDISDVNDNTYDENSGDVDSGKLQPFDSVGALKKEEEEKLEDVILREIKKEEQGIKLAILKERLNKYDAKLIINTLNNLVSSGQIIFDNMLFTINTI